MGRHRGRGKKRKGNKNTKKSRIKKVSCDQCDAVLLATPKVIARHYLREHQVELSEKRISEIATRKAGNDKKVFQCRKCGATFPRLHLFKKHYRDNHREIIRTSNSNIKSLDLVQDPEIKQYIEQNPDNYNEMGKFGVPQDPYRYGFFGSGSKEYDSWRKDKKD